MTELQRTRILDQKLYMFKWRIFVSFLVGLGLVCLFCLMMNIPLANLFLIVVFIPGARVVDLLGYVKRDWTWPLLVSNTFVYSLLLLTVIVVCFRNISEAVLRHIAVRLALPVTLMVCLTCLPFFNPLLPFGMGALSKRELHLRNDLPLLTDLQSARVILKANGIQFEESTGNSEMVMDEWPEGKLIVKPGDHILFSRFRTSATSFPCVYDLKVTLVFGTDAKLKERQIRRIPECP